MSQQVLKTNLSNSEFENTKSINPFRNYRKTNPYSLFHSSIDEITKKIVLNKSDII